MSKTKKNPKVHKVSFPHMGNYYIPAKVVAGLFGDEVLVPPPITKKTIELGNKYGPEFVCVPFKYNLGNYIEALQQGANVIVQIGGGCRMGYYGEVQKEILKKMGFEFEFIKLMNSHNPIEIAIEVKRLQPQNSYRTILLKFWLAYQKVRVLDYIEDFIRGKIGFEVKEGSFDRTFRSFLKALDKSNTVKETNQVKNTFKQKFEKIGIDKPKNPIRVGVVGEVYVVMEPFSNFFLEKELAKFGIEVHRFISISGVLHHSLDYWGHIKELVNKAKPYLRYDVGAHGTASVGMAHELAKKGFDGLIHVKPFGCMPEVNAMSAMYNISKKYQFPIIYFSFDSLTSETGIKTRLEAFYDMLIMKKKRDKHDKT